MWTLRCARIHWYCKNKDWQCDHLSYWPLLGLHWPQMLLGCAAEPHLPGTCGPWIKQVVLNRVQRTPPRQMMRSVLVQPRRHSQACWRRDGALSACTSWAPGPCDFQPCSAWQLWNCISGVRGIWVMNFSRLTMGKDLSHTHQRGLWSAAGNHGRVKTSGSLLSLTLTPTQTHGSLPGSLGVNKGKHKTPLFPIALCSGSIFSPADDHFAYPKCLIKYIHQNDDPQGNFLWVFLHPEGHSLSMPISHVTLGIQAWVYYLISLSEFNNL